MEEYRENCYFFMRVQDMSARIPTCNYYQRLGFCPCKDCTKFVNREVGTDIVRKYADVMESTSVWKTETTAEGDCAKDCNKCIYGGYYHYDKGGMPTIICCHGFENDTEEEAHNRIISEEPCEKFKEGNRLYVKRKNKIPPGRYLLEGIPANEMYRYDPYCYHKVPVGICTSFNKDNCDRGDGHFCYYATKEDGPGCSSCRRLSEPGKMVEPIRSTMLEAFRKAGVSEELITKWEAEN